MGETVADSERKSTEKLLSKIPTRDLPKLPGEKVGQSKTSVQADLIIVEDKIRRFVSKGQPVPTELERQWFYLLALSQDKRKDKAALLEKAMKMRDAGQEQFSIDDVPKDVLAKIADLKAAGITPYRPEM